ncbi:MAG: cellulase family glycosylhydrolase [Sedimentisphaerales bacterium]|nr:cellulase family glycosylhydrolase [Sedimentisphaerales bacterium]
MKIGTSKIIQCVLILLLSGGFSLSEYGEDVPEKGDLAGEQYLGNRQNSKALSNEDVKKLLAGWHGFGFFERFEIWRNEGYTKEHFQMIRDFGFNFVQLFLDYRAYTTDEDWNEFDEEKFKMIDQGIQWAREYDLHVCLCLYRAPGFCIHDYQEYIKDPENFPRLWKEKEVQDVFVNHWRAIAQRYKHIPGEKLSFLVLNEPSYVEPETYYNVIRRTAEAIRSITPDRIVMTNGLDFGRDVCPEIIPLNVVQSKNYYDPQSITEYQTSWVEGSDQWSVPTWPLSPDHLITGLLHGPWQEKPQHSWLKLQGEFPAHTRVSVTIKQVSMQTDLVIRADNQPVFKKLFDPAPDQGEWEKVVHNKQYDIYQNIYHKTYTTELTSEAREFAFGVESGDWLIFSEIKIIPPADSGRREFVLKPFKEDNWIPQATFHLSDDGILSYADAPPDYQDYYQGRKIYLAEWKELADAGTPVFISQFGIYKNTPHEVTLAWMEDLLQEMKQAGFGWCLLWFHREFGIINSDRADVEYEDYHGYKLDRKMLELLQKYI